MNQKYKTTEKWVSRVPFGKGSDSLPAGTEFVTDYCFADTSGGGCWAATNHGFIPAEFILGFCTQVVETKPLVVHVTRGSMAISESQTPPADQQKP